jgi:hypothetical protein
MGEIDFYMLKSGGVDILKEEHPYINQLTFVKMLMGSCSPK